MSEPRITNAVYELVAGLERNKKWIRRIAWAGVALPIAILMAFVPGGIVITIPVILVLAIISAVAGAKILGFLSEWDKKYAALKFAEAELTRRFFPPDQRYCTSCGSTLLANTRFCRDCGHKNDLT